MSDQEKKAPSDRILDYLKEIATLQKKNEQLKAELVIVKEGVYVRHKNAIKDLSEISALQAKLAEAQAALEWIADEKNWNTELGIIDKARTVIAKLRGQDG